MREMKNSGVEWIGDIPISWELTKIGSVYDERNTKVSDEEYAPLSVTKLGIVPQLETAAKTDNGDNRKLIKKNDFVINSRSDRRGSCGISEFDGSCSLINTVLKPRRNMSNRYYGFVFKSELFSDEYYRWGHGIVNDLWSTKWSDMKSIYIPMPPKDEQDRIADYLDFRVSQIDSIIAKQEQIIEKLKEYKFSVITEAVTKGLQTDVDMKSSGINYIGSIPQSWDVCKFKKIVKKKIDNRGRTPELLDDNNGIPLVEVASLGGKYPDLSKVKKFISNESHDRFIRDDVKKGDILVTTVGATIGKASIVDEACFCIAQNLVGYRVNDDQYPLFWYYYFKSKVFLDMFSQYDKGNTINNVKISNMEQGYVVVAPYSEQVLIAEHIDSICEKIDKKISVMEELVSKIVEYKKSLIFEVVTGKKEV